MEVGDMDMFRALELADRNGKLAVLLDVLEMISESEESTSLSFVALRTKVNARYSEILSELVRI